MHAQIGTAFEWLIWFHFLRCGSIRERYIDQVADDLMEHLGNYLE